jgi:hypothetical protein
MQREQADRALEIIRGVIQNTREDLVEHNWGVIWMIHAFLNLAACLCGWYIQTQKLIVLWYLVPFAVAGGLNMVLVMFLVKKDQGVKSYVEWQIHGVWTTFALFTLAGALAIYSSGAPPDIFGWMFSMTSGIGFAMMGVFFSRQLPYAGALLVLTVIGPFLGPWLWVSMGVVWWCGLFITGLGMHRERARRRASGQQSAIL